MTDTHKVGQSTGNRGMGRPKGSLNKTTTLLKDAILKAAEQAGGEEGIVGYLAEQATTNPGPFMALLGKVLPMTVQDETAHRYVALMPEVAESTEEWLASLKPHRIQ